MQSVQLVLLHSDQMPTDFKELRAYLWMHSTCENMCNHRITLHVYSIKFVRGELRLRM